jgi:cytochrome c biogenesis protein CcmG/thiol:disulfide interchange protein DsbE
MATSAPRARRKWVRVAWLLGPSLVFVLLLGAGMTLKGDTLEPGEVAPSVEAPTLDGDGTLALEDLRGRPVLVNFWASWCVPCEAEARYLRAAHEEYGDQIEFLGVNVKDARSHALAFVDRYDVGYAQVRDEGLDWYDAFGLTGQPETFLIDSDGEVVEHVTGEFTSSADLFRLLDVMVAREA